MPAENQLVNGSGTPLENNLKEKIANDAVTSRDVNLESNAVRKKSFVEGLKRRALMKLRGELTPEEKQRFLLERAQAKKGKSKQGRTVTGEVGFRILGTSRQLRAYGGGNNQNPLIQVGRQAPNPYLVNKPFTGQAVLAASKLRQNNYPIGFRPRGYDRELGNAGFSRARSLRKF